VNEDVPVGIDNGIIERNIIELAPLEHYTFLWDDKRVWDIVSLVRVILVHGKYVIWHYVLEV
jgi:hypothetical protein